MLRRYRGYARTTHPRLQVRCALIHAKPSLRVYCNGKASYTGATPTYTYHVQPSERVGCWIIVSDECCSSFTKLRTSTSHQHHHIFLCLATGVRCPSRDLRCTSSPYLPLCQIAPSKRFADRPSLCVQDAVDITEESFRELKDVERK